MPNPILFKSTDRLKHLPVNWLVNGGVTMLYIIIFTLINLSFLSVAKAEELKYTTPKLLQTTMLNESDDALPLLNSAEFRQQLIKLAQQLPAEFVAKQSTFSRTALLSIRQEYQTLAADIAKQAHPIDYHHYQLYLETINKVSSDTSFDQKLSEIFTEEISKAGNEAFYKTSSAMGWSIKGAQDYVFNVFKQLKNHSTLTAKQVMHLTANAEIHHVVSKVIPVVKPILATESAKRFIIEPEVLITLPNDIELTATIVRAKNAKGNSSKQTAAYQFTIYAQEEAHIRTATHAAAHGYVGIVINSRGKRLSKNKIVPFEYEGEDSHQAIDWIINQPWSNGKVVMYGGSYNGFTQWATAKHNHSALKAIAPYTAANLATGLPMENNVFRTGNYQWAFYATNNNTVDGNEYSDWQHWNKVNDEMFTSGRAFNEIDQIEGRPNPWFQKWLSHPSYDEYYQKMQPYQQDYLNINIPVLTFTGYFDGGQISAIDFLSEHYKYNKNADHSLVIGPYSHGTAQGVPRSHLGNYQLDDAALKKDTEEIVFAWFDHLLLGKAKPKLVQNKVNYQLMGNNSWHHVDSYQALNQQGQDYFLADKAFSLTTKQPNDLSFVSQKVDMADRTVEHNKDAANVIIPSLDKQTGLTYFTKVFEQDMEFSGAPTGQLSIAINKKDVDIGFNLYQIMPDGRAFHLAHYFGRASYAKDMSKRELLTPNEKTFVPIVNGRMTSRLIEKGSKIAIVVDVNKNKDAQVNMGSGKDVSTESIKDAGEPLEIKWFNDSKVHLPLKPFVH